MENQHTSPTGKAIDELSKIVHTVSTLDSDPSISEDDKEILFRKSGENINRIMSEYHINKSKRDDVE